MNLYTEAINEQMSQKARNETGKNEIILNKTQHVFIKDFQEK